MRKMLLAILLSAAWAAPSVAACRTESISYRMQGDTLDIRTTVRGSCNYAWNASATGYFKSIEITGRPAHGTLQVRNAYSVAYTARPGFQGKDAFTVRVCGNNRGADGCSTLRYHAKILLQTAAQRHAPISRSGSR